MSLTLPTDWKAWGEGFGGYHERTETRDGSGYHGSFAGLMAGMEKDCGETLVGGFAAWANHNIRGDGSSRGNWGTLGVYGGLSRDEFSAGLSVSAGIGDYSLTRGVDGPAASLIGMNYSAIRISAQSDPLAVSLSARATADWTLFEQDGWKIGPGVEAALAHTFMSGFTEHDGGGINLSVRRHSENYVEAGVGLRASKTFFRCGLPFLTASVKAAGLYGASFGSSMRARFTAGGSSFSVEPERIKSGWFVPEATLSWRATERVTVAASYQGRFGKHTSANTGSLSVGLDW
jgi:outer membrane autotransporter protein